MECIRASILLSIGINLDLVDLLLHFSVVQFISISAWFSLSQSALLSLNFDNGALFSSRWLVVTRFGLSSGEGEVTHDQYVWL